MDGADGPNGVWKFTAADGFVRGDGVAGKSGTPGGGGGGGGGTRDYYDTAAHLNFPPAGTLYFATATGAGGGAGGCPGISGTPGNGGGASVGMLIVKSGVSFENGSRIEGGTGGKGGKGQASLNGLPGGAGGASIRTASIDITGHGGAGGVGGYAGFSGQGAPGPSVGLAYTGVRPPTVQGVVIAAGTAGPTLPEIKGAIHINPTFLSTVPASVGQAVAEYPIK